MIPLSDPDITVAELEAVSSVLQTAQLSSGPMVREFEKEFARYVGRKHAVAVASGIIGMMFALKALGIGPEDEVIASSYSWRETAHAIVLCGVRPVFADIDYWSGTIAPPKMEAKISAKTRAVIAGNSNGHPAAWDALRAIANARGLALIEDSTEAIGSRYKGKSVGTFGDLSVFDFSQPGALVCGDGGMVVTDDDDLAAAVRRYRSRSPEERSSVIYGSDAPYQAGMSDVTAALGLAQLKRIDQILSARKRVESWYFETVKSFEGIKDPYVAPEVNEIHWFLYLVHLGTRFSRSSRDAIIDDLRTENVEASAYCHPMHMQPRYGAFGFRRGDLFVTEKIADRAVALPFHRHLTQEKIAFLVKTMKDASINVGAGSAIYL